MIGADALIHAGVRIGARVGSATASSASPGAVIGGDGFSFVTPEQSGVEEVRATLGQRDTPATSRPRRGSHSLGAS